MARFGRKAGPGDASRGGGTRSGAKAGRKAFERLPAATRAITFYAEDGGSWPHLGPIVTELTGPLGRDVCYLTSRADDPVLTRDDPRLHAFEIGEGLGRSFLFQTMEVGVLVATVPQLGIPVLPRSRRASALGTDYVYVFHSMASTHMIYEPDGFDHYDTVLCVGPYMVEEIRRREELHGLAPKELVEHGYGRLDAILAAAAARGPGSHPADPPVVLIAPSWGPSCIFETCGPALVRVLLDAGYEVVARPHPMTLEKTPAALPALRAEFGDHPRFSVDGDVAGQDSLHRSDLMVSDWSGAALEYAFGLERPVLFVDVPRKVNNPAYTELGIEPFEVTVREQIGRVVAAGDLGRAPALVDELIGSAAGFTEAIRAARAEHVANVGRSAPAGARLVAAKADAYLARVQGRR
jgi:YidC/Oxa1 family membrane protein insertase